MGTKDTPQPQNFAKRLLDQLGSVSGRTPIVYRDDRQVTMLYVRVDEITSATPTIHFTAQRASVIRSEMRRAPHDEARRQHFLEREGELDKQLETARGWVTDGRGDTSDLGKKFYAMGQRGERFYLQAKALLTTDYMAESLVHAYAGVPPRYPERFLRLVADNLDQLASMPYAFNLGTLPSPGGSEVFKRSLDDTIRARIEQFPDLYPPQLPVGVTAFYVPGPDGKDLDNIFRELVLPILLKHCHLPPEVRHPFGPFDDGNDNDSDGGQPRVAFIEGVALKGVPRPPGTVAVALSDGWRHRSWWHAAIDHDEHRDSNPY
ncbi:hypothetical protein [Mycolicibacterium mageritense]|uniref:hypothetical protein n=1 Tax=Mycolicibacterium mageritense TaxID=53462 RepID=UPI0011D7A1B0|nr:hypothetical protein [Mycolicibacterium mageritense]TXI64323.1 MAG: hypothetical protein E6Q55_06355 [Mycolicibacterium mageritense]